jgi:hypothetical protein
MASLLIGGCINVAVAAQKNKDSLLANADLAWAVGVQGDLQLIDPKGEHVNLRYTSPSANLGEFKVNSSDPGASIGVSTGINAKLKDHGWFPGYAITIDALQSIADSKVNGKWTYTLHSPANHYHYSYDVNVLTVGANLAIDLYRWRNFTAFIGPGCGIDWLQSRNFATDPIDASDVSTFRYTGDIDNNFYYQGEAGLRYSYGRKSLSLAYVYRDLGRVSSGAGTTQAGAIAPAIIDPVRTHNIQIGFSYNI